MEKVGGGFAIRHDDHWLEFSPKQMVEFGKGQTNGH